MVKHTHTHTRIQRLVGTCLCDWSASLEVAKVRSECYAVLWSLLSHLTRNRGTFQRSELQHKMVYAFMMSSLSVSQHIWKTLALKPCCSQVPAQAAQSSSAHSNCLFVLLKIINQDNCENVNYNMTILIVAWKFSALTQTTALFNDLLGLQPHDNRPEEEERRHMILMITSPNSCAFVHAQTEGLMWASTFLAPINPIIWLVIVVFLSWD